MTIDPERVLESTAEMLGVPPAHLREALSAALIEQLEEAAAHGLVDPDDAAALRPLLRDRLADFLRVPLPDAAALA